jgi:hypothetical protein
MVYRKEYRDRIWIEIGIEIDRNRLIICKIRINFLREFYKEIERIL